MFDSETRPANARHHHPNSESAVLAFLQHHRPPAHNGHARLARRRLYPRKLFVENTHANHPPNSSVAQPPRSNPDVPAELKSAGDLLRMFPSIPFLKESRAGCPAQGQIFPPPQSMSHHENHHGESRILPQSPLYSPTFSPAARFFLRFDRHKARSRQPPRRNHATEPMPLPRSSALCAVGHHEVPYHAVNTSSVENRCRPEAEIIENAR